MHEIASRPDLEFEQRIAAIERAFCGRLGFYSPSRLFAARLLGLPS
ncbi:MAG TPA: hypothetical protein VN880_14815 [Solirubrobacteraceae bacterium]|jgi:hypothetical protein|nr:hypothetical protein [Solirubrobacteraceae bacterium]